MSIYGQRQCFKSYLLGDLVAFPAGDSGALALGDLLGLDPGHQYQGAEASSLGLAVLDGDLLARLAVHLLAVHLRHLGAPQLGLVVALLLGEGPALPLVDLVALRPGHVLALLPLNSLTLAVIDLLALLPGHLLADLLGHGGALLGDDVAADLGVVDLLTQALGDGLALLRVDSLALALGHSAALLAGNILKRLRCYQVRHKRELTTLHSCLGTLEHTLSVTTRHCLLGTLSHTSSWTVSHFLS